MVTAETPRPQRTRREKPKLRGTNRSAGTDFYRATLLTIPHAETSEAVTLQADMNFYAF
jgi:hypothetical protein